MSKSAIIPPAMPPTRAVLSSSPSIVGRVVEEAVMGREVVEEAVVGREVVEEAVVGREVVEEAVGTEVIGTVKVAVETAEGLMLVVNGKVGSGQLRIYE